VKIREALDEAGPSRPEQPLLSSLLGANPTVIHDAAHFWVEKTSFASGWLDNNCASNELQ